MVKRIYLSLALVFITLLFLSQVIADSSSLYRLAGSVEPRNNNNIRMAEETVNVKVYAGASWVRCEFVFKNESAEEQDVLMGFPASLIGEANEIDETTRLSNFRVVDAGIEKNIQLEKDKNTAEEVPLNIAEWYTWPVHFKAGEQKVIVNTYKTQNYRAPWGRQTGYILTTGAPWKGTIGSAVITFELMDTIPDKLNKDYTKPNNYSVQGNKIIYTFKNFEPKDNLYLFFDSNYSIADALLVDKGEAYVKDVHEQIDKARGFMIVNQEHEALSILNKLLDEGAYCEDVYFDLLNAYHKKNDVEGFIKLLKDEIAHFNSPNIFNWANTLYPKQIANENLTYPKDHEPIINNIQTRLLNDQQFELSADLSDAAGDIWILSASAYDRHLSQKNLLSEHENMNLFTKKEYSYHSTGMLPEKYNDLICHLYLRDYNNDEKTIDNYYFYSGDSLKLWQLKKYPNFIISHYDEAFDKQANEFGEQLSSLTEQAVKTISNLLPNDGYVINLYDSTHFSKLKTYQPQNITSALKAQKYNELLQKSKKIEKYAYDEILIDIGDGSIDKMLDAALRQILRDNFGEGWLKLDAKAFDGFKMLLAGEKGRNKYFSYFAGIKPGELRKTAMEIGKTGNMPVAFIEHEAKILRNLYLVAIFLTLLFLTCGVILYHRRKLTQSM